MTLKVGITGGIGVGKTYCCKIFEVLGVPVYYADQRAKGLMRNNHELKQKIIDQFGKESYSVDGTVNRTYLSEKVFSNSENTKRMNAIVHPVVGMDLMKWLNGINGPYALYEAALIFESGSYQMLDKIIVVDATEELRIQRVMDRDKATRQDILKRMSKQLPQSEKVARANFIIQNNGQQSVVRQVVKIHADLLEIFERKTNQLA